MKTDFQLQSDVMAQLNWQPKINAAHIGVAAHNNIITLSGQVSHYSERATAEDTTKGVIGVKGVANEIEVELLGSGIHSDEDIAGAAVTAMKWDFEVPTDQVQVVVRKGWVTLEGTVDWQYQKDAAERCVQYLLGVKAVTNDILVKPTAQWIDVKNAIEASLTRNAKVDARRIGVETTGSTVRLSGNVSTWAERDEAITAAWSAPGVSAVTDDLFVTT
jgi:osmotically-inducible protein OsmY